MLDDFLRLAQGRCEREVSVHGGYNKQREGQQVNTPAKTAMKKRIDWDAQSLVHQQRARRGIPPWRAIDWNIQPLGLVPDADLSEKLGVPIASVAHQRRKRGFAPLRGPSRRRRGSRPAGVSRAFCDYVLAALGRCPAPARELHRRVLDEWGSCSQRSVYRALAKLKRDGRAVQVRRPGQSSPDWGWRKKP